MGIAFCSTDPTYWISSCSRTLGGSPSPGAHLAMPAGLSPQAGRGKETAAHPPHLHAQYRAMALDPQTSVDEVAPAVDISAHLIRNPAPFVPDSRRAWTRLAVAVLIGSLGSVGMWSVVVALPVVQAEFGASRGTASLAFTMVMLGFGSGGVLTGKITDRYGIVIAIGLGIGILGLGYVGAGLSNAIWPFILVHFAIGLSSSATFGPLMAEASHWFERYRGLAVAIAASGNYIGGTIWPPLVSFGIQTFGWRDTHIAVGLFTPVAMTLALIGLRVLMGAGMRRSHVNAPPPRVDLRLSTNALTAILSLAAIACCVAMSMPQVHIVAYCGDLGYGVARGAEMLSLMLGLGIISRIGSGFLADRIGGIRTLLIGSIAQGSALMFYLFFDSLTSLYLISAMFGLFQGGIVPSYAIIVREAMPASEAATRVGIVIFASVLGMSFGGFISGVIFDATGSYGAAFLNGVAWNALNVTIMLLLLMRARQRLALA
jgi:MFS family permease